jgi:hypothetical protein
VQEDDDDDDFFGGGHTSKPTGGYQGFGVLGKSRASAVSNTSGVFGAKRNSATAGDAADLLDNILDDMEEKKGLESSKKSDRREGSIGSGSGANLNSKPKSLAMPVGATDAWGRETFNEFDDLDDNKSKISGGNGAQQA